MGFFTNRYLRRILLTLVSVMLFLVTLSINKIAKPDTDIALPNMGALLMIPVTSAEEATVRLYAFTAKAGFSMAENGHSSYVSCRHSCNHSVATSTMDVPNFKELTTWLEKFTVVNSLFVYNSVV